MENSREGEERVPPPNGGHGSWFPAVCRGAPIPTIMLPHTYRSTAMPCVCVDDLYHYHFIEEPRKRLPHPHPWHTNVSQNPSRLSTNTRAANGGRRAILSILIL